MADGERKKSSFNMAPKIQQHAEGATGERRTEASVIGGDRKASLMKVELKQGGTVVDGATVAISKGGGANVRKASMGTAGSDMVNDRRKQSLGKAKRINSLRLTNVSRKAPKQSFFSKCLPCCFPQAPHSALNPDVAVSIYS
jgi:hypothetical protein